MSDASKRQLIDSLQRIAKNGSRNGLPNYLISELEHALFSAPVDAQIRSLVLQRMEIVAILSYACKDAFTSDNPESFDAAPILKAINRIRNLPTRDFL